MIIGKMQAVPAEMILPEGILNFDSSTTLIPVELNGTHFTTGGNYEGAKIIPISTPRIITPRTQSVTVLELGKRLLQSARDGNTEEVRDLMGKGAPFSTDWLGTSPLHLAAMGNHVKTCEVLLRAGICKDARTKVDRTPLHIAAYEGHSEIVDLLLVNGADVNSRDMLKMTPLHWAVQEEHKDCIKLLLQYGASIDVVSKFDKSPMAMAIEQDRTDLAQMMHVAQKLIAERLQNLELQQATLMATQSLTDQLSGTSTDNKNDETSPDDDTSNDQLDKMEMLEEDESNVNLCTNITNDLAEEKSECNGKNTQSNKIISANESIKILQAHGITIFPKNEMSVVQTATENGQTVVLTDGGKFSISNQKAVSSINNSGSQNTNNTNEQKGVLSPFKLKERKVIRLRSDQFLALANGRLPNLFKKVIPLSTNNSSATIKPVKRIVMTKNRFMVSPKLQTNVAAKMETVDSITKKLMDARRFIVEYRQKLKEKEDEVQQYENILQKLRAIKK